MLMEVIATEKNKVRKREHWGRSRRIFADEDIEVQWE